MTTTVTIITELPKAWFVVKDALTLDAAQAWADKLGKDVYYIPEKKVAYTLWEKESET